MATLGGHRANFTWALNSYNGTDDSLVREKFARRMAAYINAAKADGFSTPSVTHGQSYPVDEVNKYMSSPDQGDIEELSEEQVNEKLAEKVDTSNVTRMGSGDEFVYVYGYKCAPDRLKIGMTESNCVQRIVQQINASTPDQPILYVEIRTNHCRSLERAMHSILEHRDKRTTGGGDEWFKTTAAEIVDIYEFVTNKKSGGTS